MKKKSGNGGCGLYCCNVVLGMFGKEKTDFAFSREKGISPKKILSELRKKGLNAEPKTISIRNLKPGSIFWSPLPIDHYFVGRAITNGKVLIDDGDKKRLQWISFAVLKKKWYRWYKGRWCGWVIETRLKNKRHT